jgi:hypothetical protein
MPRWIFERCCSDPGHCTNAGTEKKLDTDFMNLHGVLIRQFLGMGVRNFKVIHSCCTPTANTAARMKELWKVMERDGIHFTAEGYQNLADRCMVCVKALLESTGKEERHSTFFWRGFKSTVDSKCIAVHRQHNTWRRGLPHGSRGLSSRGRFPPRGFHPYRRN